MSVTGKPSISDIRNNDVRSLSSAISNIRQRIEAIEGSLGVVESTVNQSSTTGSTQFNVLRQQIIALQAALTALEDVVASIAPDGDQMQIAMRIFQPHAPAAPPEPVEGTTNQIAVRAFMPHVPLAQTRDVADVAAQLAVRAFQPHVPLTQTRDVADAGAVLAAQSFAPRTARLRHQPIADEEVTVNALQGATYRTQQDFNNVMNSPGLITGGTISSAGSGNVSVAAGTAILRIANDDVSSLVFVNFSATVLAIPADTVLHFVGLTYNSGTPAVVLRSTENWDNDTEIALGSAGNVSGNVFVFNNPFLVGDPITNIIQRFDSFAGTNRDNTVGGLAIGETGTRKFTMTAGKTWSRLNDFPAAAIDTSGTDTMLSVYYNGTTWVFGLGLTQWDNLNYNDITTGLVAMGANKFSNLWFYLTFETNTVVFQYGQAQYNTAALAAVEPPPSFRPPSAASVSLLLGRFVFKQGDATTTEIDQAFDKGFNPSVVAVHNNLGGLQGGTTSEYYHLTAAEYTALAGDNADRILATQIFGA